MAKKKGNNSQSAADAALAEKLQRSEAEDSRRQADEWMSVGGPAALSKSKAKDLRKAANKGAQTKRSHDDDHIS